MRLLVIDQCSGSKDYPPESPVFDVDEIDTSSREALLEKNGVARKKARKLYAGRQQSYITEAVDALRDNGHTVDRYFISAGFGLVEESTLLPPYEATFNELPDDEIPDRAASFGLDDAIRDVSSASPSYDVIFFALGREYYLGLDLEEILSDVPTETFVVLFNQEALAEKYENVVSISARTDDAKEHGTIVVALKGVYLKYFADHVAAGRTVTTTDELIECCTSEWPPQSGFDRYE